MAKEWPRINIEHFGNWFAGYLTGAADPVYEAQGQAAEMHGGGEEIALRNLVAEAFIEFLRDQADEACLGRIFSIEEVAVAAQVAAEKGGYSGGVNWRSEFSK